MNAKRYPQLCLALLACLSLVLSLSGCTETEREAADAVRRTEVATQVLEYDNNADGVPDVFQDSLADEADDGYMCEHVHGDNEYADTLNDDGTTNLSKVPVFNVPIRVNGKVYAPFAYNTHKTALSTGAKVSSAPATDDNSSALAVFQHQDIHGVKLEGGLRYSLSLEDPQGRGGKATSFRPYLRVIAADELRRDLHSEGLDLELIYSDAGLRAVSYSFVPPTSGIYYVAVSAPYSDECLDSSNVSSSWREGLQSNSPHPYRYCIYLDSAKQGAAVQFVADSAEGDFAYTNADILDIKQVLAPYLVSEPGEHPHRIGDVLVNGRSPQEAFNTAVEHVHSLCWTDEDAVSNDCVAKTTDSSEYTKIKPFVTLSVPQKDIAREQRQDCLDSSVDLHWGSAYRALTYLDIVDDQGNPVTALATIPELQGGGNSQLLKSCFQYVEHANSNYCDKEIGGDGGLEIPVAGWGPQVGIGRGSVSRHAKNRINISAWCQRSEDEPRLLDSRYLHLNSQAQEVLGQGSAAEVERFRQRYGDYYLSGATFGMKLSLHISIDCASELVANELCSKMSITGYEDPRTDELFREIEKESHPITVTVEWRQLGGPVDSEGNVIPVAGISQIEQWSQDDVSSCWDKALRILNNFEKLNLKNCHLEPLQAQLRSYAALEPDGQPFSKHNTIKANASIAPKLRNLYQQVAQIEPYLYGYCYDLPKEDFIRDDRDEVRQDYVSWRQGLYNTIASSGTSDDVADRILQSATDYHKKCLERLNRYYFFRDLKSSRTKLDSLSNIFGTVISLGSGIPDCVDIGVADTLKQMEVQNSTGYRDAQGHLTGQYSAYCYDYINSGKYLCYWQLLVATKGQPTWTDGAPKVGLSDWFECCFNIAGYPAITGNYYQDVIRYRFFDRQKYEQYKWED